ncbi:hypothetical protein AAIH70_25335 [Neorhizobium sp. BT27B]|uniref:hypothetical protein n=1 Tax=Neorhizobium sp. BT27B TaxID=3142625 RepID=UPI003D2CB013
MPEFNQTADAPSVQLNIEDGTASYLFREQSYMLPGTYSDIDVARRNAEEQCRGLGWSGSDCEAKTI